MRYFKQFPEIEYNKYTVKNIFNGVKIEDVVKNSSAAYYPYTVVDGQQPWMIAADYYGDPNLVWLIYLANNIIDPYYDWHLDTVHFEEYIKKEYGSIAAAQSQLLGYKEVVNGEETGILFSADTYENSSDSNKSNWLAYYSYDDENDKNEARRHIKLLSRGYAAQAEANLKAILSR